MRILGIDPGINITGYGVVEKGRSRIDDVVYGEIRRVKDELLSKCLARIYDDLMEVVKNSTPDAIALEDIFYGKNVKSLIKQAQVRGVVMLAGSHSNIPIYEYTPLEVKKAVVGYGRAEKRQVQQMVKAILNLSKLPPVDASDALAVAICHSNFLKAVST
ncbi:MAG: crossover junction endodeoxyribonuclease RuvC [Thermodesulfobacteriota bacterium]|nr:crossover junction endodeoxyribonuclease RuvC [Thermodesulfobacteriota bacterium]